MDPRDLCLTQCYVVGLRRSPFVSLPNRDLCLTHHCDLGLRRFLFGVVTKGELRSQEERKVTHWRVVLREGSFVFGARFCNEGKLNVSN